MKACWQLCWMIFLPCVDGWGAAGQGSYTIIDLHPLGATRSEARLINNRGLVLCTTDAAGTSGYFIGSGAGLHTPLETVQRSRSTVFSWMNDQLTLAGTAVLPLPESSMAFAGFQRPYQLFVPNSEGRAINNVGVIAGVLFTSVQIYPGGPYVNVRRAIRLDGKSVKNFGTLAGPNAFADSDARALNLGGTIVGWSSFGPGLARHAFRAVAGGAMSDIHSIVERSNSVAIAINNAGQIAGYAHNFATEIDAIPFLWSASEGMTLLPLLPGDNRAVPLGMNNRGDVVGVGSSSGLAILWRTNRAIILQDLLPANSGWHLDAAYSINDYGQIVGYGRTNFQTHAFLLTQTNPPPPARISWDLLDPVPSLLAGAEVTGDFDQLRKAPSYGNRRAGTAADGVTRLVVRLSVIPGSGGPGTFTLSLLPGRGAVGTTGNADEDGSLGLPGEANRSGTVTVRTRQLPNPAYWEAYAVYQAPKTFDRSSANEAAEDARITQREVQLALSFQPDGGAEVEELLPVTITRPPVVVMHGIWSNRRDAFGAFEAQIKEALPGLQITGPNYPNAVYFALNDQVLFDEVNQAKMLMRQRGFASTRVDVFAHSMGGVLSRIWSQDARRYRRPENFLAGDINRLVTIDSPHHGSWFADLARRLKLDNSPLYGFLRASFFALDMPIDQGAGEDLSSFSSPMEQMNSQTSNVPSHAIIGDIYVNLDLDVVPAQIRVDPTFKLLQTLFVLDGLVVPFPVNSDLIVSAESQAGGLTPPQTTSFAHVHTGASTTTSVIERSRLLLLASPGDANQFARGFPASRLPFRAEGRVAIAESSTKPAIEGTLPLGGLEITAPTDGAIVPAGRSLTVIVAPTNGFTPTNLLLVTRGFVETRTNGAFTFAVPIASNAIGPQTILVGAADARSNIVSTRVSVQVRPSAALVSLNVEPPVLNLTRPGAQYQLAVSGLFADGVERDIAGGGSGTTYLSDDPNVVTVDTNGVVAPRSDGNTFITIANAGRLAIAEVNVELSALANLALSATATPPQPYESQPVTYTLSVSNRGPATASSVVLISELPPGAALLGANTSEGVCTTANGSLICALGTLTNGASAAATVQLAFASPGTVSTSFLVTLLGVDPDAQDNQATVAITVLPGTRIQVRLDRATLVFTVSHPGNGFVLEQTESLAPPVIWMPVLPLPPNPSDPVELQLPISEATRFYRLSRTGN